MQTTKRNREATINRVVEALEEILTEEGFEGVSVNAIAQKAAISKLFIYRYFGGVEGLLEYYVRLGRLVPHYTPAGLEQIQPTQPQELAPIWSAQVLHLFRQIRTSRAGRELVKATVKENDPIAAVVSQNLDGELTNWVDQLAFVEGGDHRATSAIMLGALSYLTILAQLNRPMLGLDLRSEADWRRIEEAVKAIYKALNQQIINSPTIKLVLKPASQPVSTW